MPDKNSDGYRKSQRQSGERARAERDAWKGGPEPTPRPRVLGKRQSPGPVPRDPGKGKR